MALATGGRDPSVFLITGKADQGFVTAAAASAGLDLSSGRRSVLDWGCGCGRLARHWPEANPQVELFGCDIAKVPVRWCQKNLPFGKFTVCGVQPPLPYADAQFDLVYSISVLTHLNFDSHYRWMHELWRILKPGGVIVLTEHGPSILPIIFASIGAGDTSKMQVILIDEELFLCIQRDEGANETGSLITQRAFTKIFHPFQVRDYQARLGLMGIQDTYVLTKKADGPLDLIPLLFERDMTGQAFRAEVPLTLRQQRNLCLTAAGHGLLSPATIRLAVHLPGGEVAPAESAAAQLPQKVAWTKLQEACAFVAIEQIPEWNGPATLSIAVDSTSALDGVRLTLAKACLF